MLLSACLTCARPVHLGRRRCPACRTRLPQIVGLEPHTGRPRTIRRARRAAAR